MADTHTVMPKKLAQALMEAGMQHFDVGGSIAPLGGTGGALLGMNDYSATGPTQTSQGNLSGQASNEYNQQQDVYGQQQGLANQLLQQTQGGGPGQQLVNQQGSNLANQQAALMASQRGASANPALLARQAAQQGVQGQQNVLNAQAALQLQSQGALAQQQAQMANQSLQGQSIQQGAIASQNNANLSAQGINAGISGQNAQQSGSIFGQLIGGGASAIGGLFGAAHGGEIPSQKLAEGGPVLGVTAGGWGNVGAPMQVSGIQNFGGQMIGMPNYMQTGTPDTSQAQMYGSQLGKYLAKPGSGGATTVAGGAGDAGGGAAGALDVAALASTGGNIGQMLAGGNVPGKANVPGDSKKNDVVPTMLSPGEDVIPRSISQMPDGEIKDKKVLEFMHHIKSGKKPGYKKIAQARRG